MNEALIEMEQSILGSILLEPSLLEDEAFMDLRQKDFYISTHQVLFNVLCWMNNNNIPIDAVTLTETCLRKGHDPEVFGGLAYISSFKIPTTSTASYYAKKLKEESRRREAKEKLVELTALLERGDVDLENFIHKAEMELDGLRSQHVQKTVTMKDLKDRMEQFLTTKGKFVPTGFKCFDNWFFGLERGRLCIVAGRPAAGKTALALQMTTNMASGKEGPVVFFTQEMSVEQLMLRILASWNKAPYKMLRSLGEKLGDEKMPGHAKEPYREILRSLMDKYDQMSERMNAYFHDKPYVAISEVRSIARRIKRENGGKLGAIVVDYLQIMDLNVRPNDPKHEAIGRITGKAKQIARELDCPFVMLSQLSRGAEVRTRPTMSDLKDSGSIEQDADYILALYHSSEDDELMEQGKLEPPEDGKWVRAFWLKARDDGNKEFRFNFVGSQMAMLGGEEV